MRANLGNCSAATHIERVNAAAESLVRAMTLRGPYVRFV
jgi:hypothetical protein